MVDPNPHAPTTRMRGKILRWALLTLVLIVLLVATALFSFSTGELAIPFRDIFSILRSGIGIEYQVLTGLRLPRVLLAFGTGGALSLSGVLLQGIYRNPLVEPYTLGISGGAALGVALAISSGLHRVYLFFLPLSGFLGALATLVAVYLFSLKKGALQVHRMLLTGVMVSFVCSSAVMFVMSVSTSENLHGIIFWTMGSLDEPDGLLIRVVVLSALAGLALSYLFARPLNALRLGEVKARHLGINTNQCIRVLFLISSLLTGICVSVVGIIGFVGLLVPHLTRSVVGTDYRILLISSFLGGGIFLILCDILARTLTSPHELPIGVITGMAGGLIFILVLGRSKFKLKQV
jgi:iron complex transport system permease protein